MLTLTQRAEVCSDGLFAARVTQGLYAACMLVRAENPIVSERVDLANRICQNPEVYVKKMTPILVSRMTANKLNDEQIVNGLLDIWNDCLTLGA